MSRSEPTIAVQCDDCNDVVDVGLTALAGGAYDERNVDQELQRMGWTAKDGKDYCDYCTEQRGKANE